MSESSDKNNNPGLQWLNIDDVEVEWLNIDDDNIEIKKHPDKSGIISRALAKIAEQGKISGQGQEADIIWYNDPSYKRLCIKSNVRATEKSVFTNTIKAESKIQDITYKLLNGAEDCAQIPLPIALFSAKEEKYEHLIMKFLEGKTLWRAILEEIFNSISEREWEESDAFVQTYKDANIDNQTMLDSEVETVIVKLLKIENLSNKEKKKAIFSRLKKRKPFLDKKYLKQTKNALDRLHKAGIFHRDLHPRNLMIGKDGKAYLIDFGHSILGTNLPEDIYHEEKFGRKLAYDRDEGILDVLKIICEGDQTGQNGMNKELLSEQVKTVEQIKNLLKFEENDKVYKDGAEFIESLMKNNKLESGLRNSIMFLDVAMFEKYAIFLIQQEFDKFKTTKISFKILDDLINTAGNVFPIRKKILELKKLYKII